MFGVTEHKEAELRAAMAACGIKECDLNESFVRSSKSGGQNVNKVSTCVQLEHVPSGLRVKVQDSRTQGLNRFLARRRLVDLYKERILKQPTLRSAEADKKRKQKQNRRRKSRQKYDATGDGANDAG